ncbi:MAG: efflux RND transporter permease subunit [Nitrospirae bacterium]|nr:efflux RND transporter permease subunit [Nitrospirota bacterium]
MKILADWSLRNRTTTLVLTVVMLFGGMAAYQKLSRLEDPEFTIKDALILTPYPGATAAEVEEEVSDKIELAVQQLGQLDWVESFSYRGFSRVQARIKDQYDKSVLPQVWDELRRKVNDVQGDLPPGAGPSIVNDDFGDVWGVLFAVYASHDEYSYAELKEYAKLLRRELLLEKDVGKIDFWGDRTEAVYVEPNRERMSQLGVHPDLIIEKLRRKNIVADAGRVEVGTEFIAIDPTGTFTTVRQFGNLLISGEGSESQIFLKDVANVRRGYVEPPIQVMRYDGHRAIGLGISTVKGGNAVVMGDAVKRRLDELKAQTPLGMDLAVVSHQGDAVTTAINGFMVSLVEAVAIVIVVLLIFMGLRSSLIIGFVLVLTICGTFIFMGPWNVALERISLGALIIALGMLVDNAIVVVDGMLVKIQQGQNAEDAARDVVGQQAIPLLGATAVAIMAFGAIGLSDDGTGEYCRSLFQVVFLSLGLSWITAVTTTPVLCVMFLKPPVAGAGQSDPYGGRFYQRYRGLLRGCLRMRWLTMGVVGGVFLVSMYGFQFVDRSFFPDSPRPQFIVDFWLPQGIHIDNSVKEAGSVEKYLLGLDDVTHVSTFVGAGTMRFILTYDPEKENSGYVMFLVDVDDYRKIPDLIPQVEKHLEDNYPNAVMAGKSFRLGPGTGGRIQARLMGPDPNVLRKLEAQALTILEDDGGAKNIRTDWRQRVKLVRPQLAEEEADLAGITRPDVAWALKEGFEGETVGVYRDRDELLPIIVRAPEEERSNIESINAIQIWSRAAERHIPLRQVVSGFDTIFEDDIIVRLNRKRTLTIHADARSGPPTVVFNRVRPQIEALDFPPGYELEWWGEYRDTIKAQAGIGASIPFFFACMVLITIALFNGLRQAAVIWLTVPLALIGVTFGLLLMQQPFNFTALLGFMSLAGMLIKNAIVLIDQMDLEVREGKGRFQAIMDSGVSRLRPVAMAALTTALGMIPLLFDVFFIAMAVTIIFGLMVATVLTMVVVPVLYAMFFRVAFPKTAGAEVRTT